MSTLPQAGPRGRYAALYVRQSGPKQVKGNVWSRKDQLALARLGTDRGLRVVLYDERAGSGETIEERPVMQGLLSDLDTGRISVPTDVDGDPVPTDARLEAIIAVDWNRLSRDEDLMDGLRIKKSLKDNGALFLTPGRVYDFETETDGFLAQLEIMFAAAQKQKLVKATTRGQYAKARAGGYVGSAPPFGYRVVFDVPHADGRPRGRLVIDLDEAETVREMFRLYADGETDPKTGEWRPLSQGQVARLMNARGFRLRVRPSTGNSTVTTHQAGDLRAIEPTDVQRITTHRAYLGYFGWGEKKQSKWVRGEGPAEAHRPELQIVDLSLWQRAQRVRQERAAGPRRTACSVRPLVGVLHCPNCHAILLCTGVDKRHSGPEGAYVGYQCSTYRRLGRGACRGNHVAERPVRQAVEALLLEHLQEIDLGAYLERRVQERAATGQDAKAREYRDRLTAIKQELDNLVRAIAKGTLEDAEARNVKLELLEERERLQEKLRRLESKLQPDDQLLEALAYARDLPGLLSNMNGAHFRRLARFVFSRVEAVTEGNGPVRTGRIVDHEHAPEFLDLLSTIDGSATAPPPYVDLDAGPFAPLLAVLLPARTPATA